jgi:hypothetical protein
VCVCVSLLRNHSNVVSSCARQASDSLQVSYVIKLASAVAASNVVEALGCVSDPHYHGVFWPPFLHHPRILSSCEAIYLFGVAPLYRTDKAAFGYRLQSTLASQNIVVTASSIPVVRRHGNLCFALCPTLLDPTLSLDGLCPFSLLVCVMVLLNVSLPLLAATVRYGQLQDAAITPLTSSSLYVLPSPSPSPTPFVLPTEAPVDDGSSRDWYDITTLYGGLAVLSTGGCVVGVAVGIASITLYKRHAELAAARAKEEARRAARAQLTPVVGGVRLVVPATVVTNPMRREDFVTARKMAAAAATVGT